MVCHIFICKAIYLEKKRGCPHFSLWIPIDLLFPHGPNLAQKPLYLVGTVLKAGLNLKAVFWLGIMFLNVEEEQVRKYL